MKHRSLRVAVGLMALTVGVVAQVAHPLHAAAVDYRLFRDVHVGGEGGWDYLTVDPEARRLYVTHSTKIVVIDLDTFTVIGEIGDLSGVHGFAVAPDLHRGFASNGQTASVTIVDLGTLKAIGSVKTGDNPDAVLYDPGSREVYAFNGRSNSATVFAADSGNVLATVPLPGKPEFATVDTAAHRVYVNVEDQNEVVAINDTTHTVAAVWPIAPGEAASGMAIDRGHHRLFLVCENKLMVMMDSETGKVVATVPIDAGTDAAAFDPGTGLAFSSNGEGTVTIAHEESPEKLIVVQTLTTQRSARTMTLDPSAHNIFLSAATPEPMPEPPPGAPRQRPKMMPDTFRVLVYGPGR